MPGKRMPCTGDANCYWRHYRRGEPACPASLKAAAAAKRRWRATQLWHGKLPYRPEDDQHIHPTTPEKDAKAAPMRAAKKAKAEARKAAQGD